MIYWGGQIQFFPGWELFSLSPRDFCRWRFIVDSISLWSTTLRPATRSQAHIHLKQNQHLSWYWDTKGERQGDTGMTRNSLSFTVFNVCVTHEKCSNKAAQVKEWKPLSIKHSKHWQHTHVDTHTHTHTLQSQCKHVTWNMLRGWWAVKPWWMGSTLECHSGRPRCHRMFPFLSLPYYMPHSHCSRPCQMWQHSYIFSFFKKFRELNATQTNVLQTWQQKTK